MRLEPSLRKWIQAGLISPAQAEKIRLFEGENTSSWVTQGFLFLGIAVVAVGVISLIAANWAFIPGFAKLGGAFLCLGGLVQATYRSTEAGREFLGEGLILFYILACLATIGLIGQVFHSHGHLYQALLFWSLITFPTVALAKRSFGPFLWATGFFCGLSATILEGDLSKVFQTREQFILLGSAIPLLAAALTVLVGSYLSGGLTKALRQWAVMAGIAAIPLAESLRSNRLYSSANPLLGPSTYYPAYILSIVCLFAIYLNKNYRRVQRFLLLLALVAFLVMFHLPWLSVSGSMPHALCSVAYLSLLAMFLASMSERGLFQLFATLMGLRFLILYFEALGGLALTGVGLIVSGILIIVLAVIWNKNRKSLADWAERVLQ